MGGSLSNQFQGNLIGAQEGAEAQEIEGTRGVFYLTDIERPGGGDRRWVLSKLGTRLVEQG